MAAENGAAERTGAEIVRGAAINVPLEAEKWLLGLASAYRDVEEARRKIRAFEKEIINRVEKRFTDASGRCDIEAAGKAYHNEATVIRRSELVHLQADLVAAERYRLRLLKRLDTFDLGEGLGHLADAAGVNTAIDYDGRRTVTIRVGVAVREVKLPVVMDAGVWRAATYEQGDAVSHAGSYWVATRDTALQPGTVDSGWRLIVKHGKDAKR